MKNPNLFFMNKEITPLENFIFSTTSTIIVLAVVSEISILLYSSYQWLKYGTWKVIKITGYISLQYLEENWLGIYKIFDTSLAILLPIFCMLVIAILHKIVEEEK